VGWSAHDGQGGVGKNERAVHAAHLLGEAYHERAVLAMLSAGAAGRRRTRMRCRPFLPGARCPGRAGRSAGEEESQMYRRPGRGPDG